MSWFNVDVIKSLTSPAQRTCLGWFLSLLLSLSVPAHAQEPETDPYPYDVNIDCTDLFPEDDQAAAEPSIFSFLDEPQKTLSSGLETMVRSVDEFFANEKVFYESSGSYVRYSIDNLWEEGGRFTTTGDLNIGIHLRRTEEKLKLIIESEPPEKRNTLDLVTKNPTPDQEKDNNLYAGVQREYGEKERWRFKPSIGLKLHFPIEYYFRLRAFRDVNFEKWRLHLVESAYWFDTTGAGFDSSMEWDRLLGDDLLFRSGSLLRYTDERDYFDMSQVFYLIHTLSSRSAITYSIGAFGISEPAIHATDYVLNARFRQIIHSDYLFLELVPQVRHRIDYDFKQELSFLLRLEWLFTR